MHETHESRKARNRRRREWISQGLRLFSTGWLLMGPGIAFFGSRTAWPFTLQEKDPILFQMVIILWIVYLVLFLGIIWMREMEDHKETQKELDRLRTTYEDQQKVLGGVLAEIGQQLQPRRGLAANRSLNHLLRVFGEVTEMATNLAYGRPLNRSQFTGLMNRVDEIAPPDDEEQTYRMRNLHMN